MELYIRSQWKNNEYTINIQNTEATTYQLRIDGSILRTLKSDIGNKLKY